MAKIPRIIRWGFDPNRSDLEALKHPQDRIEWSVIRAGHIVDQDFNGTIADFGRDLRYRPPTDVEDLIKRADRFGLQGYGVTRDARTPFAFDREWWGELLAAWRGEIVLEHQLPAGTRCPWDDFKLSREVA